MLFRNAIGGQNHLHRLLPTLGTAGMLSGGCWKPCHTRHAPGSKLPLPDDLDHLASGSATWVHLKT